MFLRLMQLEPAMFQIASFDKTVSDKFNIVNIVNNVNIINFGNTVNIVNIGNNVNIVNIGNIGNTVKTVHISLGNFEKHSIFRSRRFQNILRPKIFLKIQGHCQNG